MGGGRRGSSGRTAQCRARPSGGLTLGCARSGGSAGGGAALLVLAKAAPRKAAAAISRTSTKRLEVLESRVPPKDQETDVSEQAHVPQTRRLTMVIVRLADIFHS